MPPSIDLWIAGSAQTKAFTPYVLVAWQTHENGVMQPPCVEKYEQEGGCTLYLAYLRLIADYVMNAEPGSHVHFFVPLSAIAEMFSKGRLAAAAQEGFRKKPKAHRAEARILWEAMQSRRIAVTSAVPEAGSDDASRCDQLYKAADRKRRGIAEPTMEDLKLNEDPWHKDDPDFWRKRAMERDPWDK